MTRGVTGSTWDASGRTARRSRTRLSISDKRRGVEEAARRTGRLVFLRASGLRAPLALFRACRRLCLPVGWHGYLTAGDRGMRDSRIMAPRGQAFQINSGFQTEVQAGKVRGAS